ncbi:phage tail protein [Brevibacillus laterosporus]|uniref:phage tail sheath subtilisin-like domain-containing protein n=1 Tax=Brevibacillus laterosporus TaxID=1465 RepID=UPI000BD7845D|nr:phage tail sheath subtilisin-like domain-containing protein [Brevibacillus laterosporus]PCN44468.1 phage tail protein [Brevibacillus laterosporus]
MIQRERPGVTVELKAKATERVLPKSGIALVPYQAEWGAPDEIIKMIGYEERIYETFGRTDALELAAESGATLLGYRMTNGKAKAASYVQAKAIRIEARYPGLIGNEISFSILPSSAEPGKKELRVIGPAKDEKFSFKDVQELITKTEQSMYIAVTKEGDQDIAEVSETYLTGAESGTEQLVNKDFVTLFQSVGGADFDAMYLPSTDDAILAAAKQYIEDRRKQSKKLSTLVVGGKKEEDTNMQKQNERSVAMDARFVVNCAISGTHNKGKEYSSVEWAAWLAGMIAATPAHISLTAQPVPLKRAKKDWGFSEIQSALNSGTLIAVRDGDSYLIESAVNTLNNLKVGEREDFGKIRVSMTLDQIVNDITSVGKKYKGKLDNNDIGGATFVGAVKTYLEVREAQGALDTGWIFEDKKNGVGDKRGFRLAAKPLDAIEIFDVEWEVL